RIDRRAGAAGDDERRAAEEELVDAVGVAIFRQLFHIEHLAHGQPHGRNHYPVPGLIDFRGLVRPHLDAPGVGADRGDLLLVTPIAILEPHARRRSARIDAPVLLAQTPLHLAGAQNDEIAAPDLDFRLLGAFVELVVGNRLAVSSQGTPRKRATSSSTPRPTILFLVCSMPSLPRPLQSTSRAS